MKARKRTCILLVLSLLLVLFSLSVSGAEAEPNQDALVTYGYLQNQLDALRQELLDAIGDASGVPSAGHPQSGGSYRDVTLERGSVITLGMDAEVIFRGGNAVVLSVSDQAGAGVTELASGTELFSGAPLQFAHIYYQTTSGSRVALLVTGDKASFTLKGTYAIT